VVLFGGSASGYLADTWEWDGAQWTQRTPALSPSARNGLALAYDSARARVVLFGGGTATYLADTWEWDGTTWVNRMPAVSPPARDTHALAYDSARGRVVLFGGVRSSRLADTWEWDGTTWVNRTPAVSPPGRNAHALAYDSARGRVVLFGGYDGNGYLGDTWEYGPQSERVCDGLDDNGNGLFDEGCDDDGDDFCDATMTLVGLPSVCPQGGGDCDDANPSIRPGAQESCDGLDNDCDGATDEEDNDRDGVPECSDKCPGLANSDQRDADGDGLGDPCDTETCGDGIDNDGDLWTDEGCSSGGSGATLTGWVRFLTAPWEWAEPVLIKNARVTLCRKRAFRDDCRAPVDAPTGEYSFSGLADGEYNIKAELTYSFTPYCDGATDLECAGTTIENYAGDEPTGYPVTIASGVVRGDTHVVFPRPVVLVRGIDTPCWFATSASGYWRSTFEFLTQKDTYLPRQLGEKEIVVYIARNIDGSGLHADNQQALTEFLRDLTTDDLGLRSLTDGPVSIDLVAHSMGGTIARHYLASHPSDRVNLNHLVMIATPNAGITDLLYRTPPCWNPWLPELSWVVRKEFNAQYPDYDVGTGQGIMGDVKYIYVAGDGSVLNTSIRLETARPNDSVVMMQSVVPWLVAGEDSDRFRGLSPPLKDESPYSSGYASALCNHEAHSGIKSDNATLDAIEKRLTGRTVAGMSCAEHALAAEAYNLAAGVAEGSALLLTEVSAAGPGGAEAHTVALDEVSEVQFLATWTTGSVSVTLIDPTGTVIDPNATDPNVTYEQGSESGETYSLYVVISPAPGTWTVRMDLGADYASTPTPLRLSVRARSPLGIQGSTASPDYTTGSQAVFQAAMTDASGPVTGATCTATPDDPNMPPSPIPLADDGMSPDVVAGDGIYSCLGPAETTAGLRSAQVRCEGVHPTLGAYERIGGAVYAVTRPVVSFTDAYAETTPDLNGNGLHDSLDLSVETDVALVGRYTVTGWLNAPLGTRISSASTTLDATSVGPASVTLRFPGPSIREAGIDGPYTLSDLGIYESITGLSPIDHRSSATTTNPYLAVDFEPRDSDGDGTPDAQDNCPRLPGGGSADSDGDGAGDQCDNCAFQTNAGQADQDGDGVGDACDNCVSRANVDQRDMNADGIGDACDPDADSDGVPNVTDCAPYNPLTSDLPAEVESLSVDSSGVDFTWMYPAGVDPGELFRYVAVRGSVSEMLADGGFPRAICRGSVLSGATYADQEAPVLGQAFYYLVAAANACAGPDFGVGSDGLPRLVTACP